MHEHHPASPIAPPAVGDCHGIPFDPSFLPRLLLSATSCTSSFLAARAVSALHAAGLKLGALPASLPASNALISAYSHADLLPSALRAFYLLSHPSTASYTTVLSALSRHGRPHEALSLFAAAASAVAPDAELLSCLVSCCRRASALLHARAAHAYGLKTVAALAFYASAGPALVALYARHGKVGAARRVFGYMDGEDVVSWNSMIGGFASAGMDGEAWVCFREMRSRGVRGNARTAVVVLGSCDMESGRQVHGTIVSSHGGSSKAILWNALMSMYSRAGCVTDAERVFLETVRKDVVSWNVMIGAFAKNGYGERALELVDMMLQCGMKPDSVTFTAILMACCHCGLVDEGLELFQRFVSIVGLIPTMEQCACIVDLLARAGRFMEALDFIGQMSVRPNAVVWGALLSASRMHHNMEFARIAFEQLVQVEPENAGNFVTMSNIYAKAGMVEDAKRVRMMIDGVELAKPSGQSCVEVL
ncbi:pentatricopeptide repeat-containing protein DOT4, chloroplastic-like [Miscanthus floridulus]|uniref:pentatricopeptide repeat-containing protein DOT4, chloroplastic-like n=1 Tax=Miscanthus floridulus TaxID=154761 RepID=UPI00345A086F